MPTISGSSDSNLVSFDTVLAIFITIAIRISLAFLKTGYAKSTISPLAVYGVSERYYILGFYNKTVLVSEGYFILLLAVQWAIGITANSLKIGSSEGFTAYTVIYWAVFPLLLFVWWSYTPCFPAQMNFLLVIRFGMGIAGFLAFVVGLGDLDNSVFGIIAGIVNVWFAIMPAISLFSSGVFFILSAPCACCDVFFLWVVHLRINEEAGLSQVYFRGESGSFVKVYHSGVRESKADSVVCPDLVECTPLAALLSKMRPEENPELLALVFSPQHITLPLDNE